MVRGKRAFVKAWCTPQERRELQRLADEAGVTVSDAIRRGALQWLLDRLE